MRVSEEAPGVAMMMSVLNGTSSHVSGPTEVVEVGERGGGESERRKTRLEKRRRLGKVELGKGKVEVGKGKKAEKRKRKCGA